MDTCIFLYESKAPNDEVFLAATFRDKADIPRLSEAFEERAFLMNVSDLSANGWVLTSSDALNLLEKLQRAGTSLQEYVDEGFHMGVKTGCNDAFIVDASVQQRLIAEDSRSNELIKPVLRGRDLKKWKTGSTGDYLIFIPRGIDIEQYPVIKDYLNQYRESLESRASGRYEWYEIQANTAYYLDFDKPKIIYPDTAKSLYACYDTTKSFGLNTIHFIPTNDLSLLAILNSKLFDWYARHKFQSINDPWEGGRLRFFAQYMARVPIADQTDAQKAELSGLVKQILVDPQSDGIREIEKKIDELVYRLYGLTNAEIELIKRTYRDAGMEI